MESAPLKELATIPQVLSYAVAAIRQLIGNETEKFPFDRIECECDEDHSCTFKASLGMYSGLSVKVPPQLLSDILDAKTDLARAERIHTAVEIILVRFRVGYQECWLPTISDLV